MRKKKKGGTQHEKPRFEQISLFEFLLEDDDKEPDKEFVGGNEQPTLFDFADERETGSDLGSDGTGNQSSLQSGSERIDDRDADRNSSIRGADSTSQSNIGQSQGIDLGLADETENNEKNVLQRIRLNTQQDQRFDAREKIRKNLEAIELLNFLEHEGRQAYEDEQMILAGFSGWGGCPQLFNTKDDTYQTERRKLKELVSIQEYQDAKASTLTSFFTPLEIIRQIYRILDRLGFEKGKILETSMGTGNFIGMMPDDMFDRSAIYGIELDPISASISSQLYPSIDVQNIGFENCPFPDNQFDIAISNVPFGTYQLHDRKFNKYHFNIHNYFFAKALDKVRDGGLIAFITTSETMDGNSGIMEYINEKADFLGAIRLPNNVFMMNGANTRVTSDVIFLKRNDNKAVDKDSCILKRVQKTEHRKVNQYFIENPQMVFGTIAERSNQFGGFELTVAPDDISLEAHFGGILNEFSSVYVEKQEEIDTGIYTEVDIEHSHYPSDAFFVENDQLYYRDEEVYYPVKTVDQLNGIDCKYGHVSCRNETEIKKIRLMVEMADNALRVINAQSKGLEEEIYLNERNSLNRRYDDFVRQFGALHKKSNLPLLSSDPRTYLLDSLETYDNQTKAIIKSKLFTERTIKAKKEIKSVDNVYDGLLLSLDNRGKIDIGYISALYGKNEEITKKELIDKQYIFIEPLTEEMVLADDYLSGNVRKKLRIARDNGYDHNAEALEKVMPDKIEAQDIVIQLGASWVPERFVKEFMVKVFELSDWQESRTEVAYDNLTGTWVLDTAYPAGVVTTIWGVESTENLTGKRQPEYNGYDLIENILNSKTPTIRNYWDVWSEEKQRYITKSELNAERTTQARELAEKLNDEWEDWIFSDTERREYLVELYNEKFNSIRLPTYDGSYLTFPEMNASIHLEDYQKNAVARILNKNANTLLWQKVGSGKTFEMVAGGMEMKRLGIHSKILYVVPNHLLNQWQNEFLTLYPNAHILVATKKDFAKERRQAFVNKIVTENFDAIIMAHSSFGMISVGKETQIDFEQRELNEITNAIEDLKNDSSQNAATKRIKILERTKKSIEKRIKTLTDSVRDNNLIPFEDLGIDFLFVDESHEFKNLYMYTSMTNVVGLQTASSQKAQDMYMKCRIIQESGGNVCFATGTPVTNTMAELYTLQRFLQLEELHNMNIFCFDAWAKAFGKVINSFEISIDGSQFVNRSKFARFFNVEELMTVFKQVAEIQTEKMLREALEKSTTGRKMSLPPKHIGGKPTIISIEPSEELEDYIADIVKRSEKIHDGSVDSREDNMLKVTSDSKKASIDMRLIGTEYKEDSNGKLWTIARKVKEVYEEYQEDKATQLIFCDSSTPANKSIPMKYVNGEYIEDKEAFHNVYHELKKYMVQLGIPESEIAFIHDYETEAKKQKLFNQMNNGTMRVLLGSTPKLGAGTNIQQRLVAIHHVDVPWKASDIEQQNGRGFRQGNMFREIYEFRYVTKKSFDAYSWQMVETKSTYMEQLLSGANGMREFEEEQQASFSYAEVKAIASGNPIIKEKFEVDNEVKRLEGLKKHYRKQKISAQDKLVRLPVQIKNLNDRIELLEHEWRYFKPLVYKESEIEDKFLYMDETGRKHTKMKDAWEASERIYKSSKTFPIKIGEYLGADIFIDIGSGMHCLKYKTNSDRWIEVETVNSIGRVNFVRILKSITNIKDDIVEKKHLLELRTKELSSCETIVAKPFEYDEQLHQLKIRQKEINTLLDADKKEIESEDNDINKQDEAEIEMEER